MNFCLKKLLLFFFLFLSVVFGIYMMLHVVALRVFFQTCKHTNMSFSICARSVKRNDFRLSRRHEEHHYRRWDLVLWRKTRKQSVN